MIKMKTNMKRMALGFVAAAVSAVFAEVPCAEIELSADGKVLSAAGAKVTECQASKPGGKVPALKFRCEPEKGEAELKLKISGLKPKNWFVLSDGFRVGKWTDGELARGVSLGRQPAGVFEVGKHAGIRMPANWSMWKGLLREIKSTYDGTMQKCYFWAPEKAKTEAVPLVVGLHTWSGNWTFTGHYSTSLKYAQANGWAMVGPNFRGANNRPEACGGDPAVQDIVDAVNYAKATVKIDPKRVYIIGGSGGGHMTLLMAGRHPEIWAGCAAFCPITDVARWHADSMLDHPGRSKGYAQMLEMACGGTPAEKPEQYRHRSPLTWIDRAREAKIPVYIVTGIHDGWKGSVPVGHSFRAFNALADEADRVSEKDIDFVEAEQKVPEAIAYKGENDPFYSQRMYIHFRRTSANVRFTLFEGGHGGNYQAGLDFLSRQVKGNAADFSLPEAAKAREEKLGH